MDDKLIRLARKVKAIEDELDKVTQIKDLEGLLFVKRDIINQYKKSINEIVNMYKDYISSTKSELSNTMKTIQKEHKDDKVTIDNIETKISTIKEDIKNICTGIDKSIESIQKDILKDIKEKNSEILLNFGKKDKEIAEVKKEILPLVKDLKALKDLVNKLELQKGDDGKSAYEIACELGFKGTKEEWIKSLHGKDGQDIELRGLRGFSDVKKDNKSYLRKNKKWVEYEEYDDTEIRKDISEIQEEQTEQNTLIATLQEENTRLKATLPTTTGTGTNITLDKTAEMEFVKPPLPRGNSTQATSILPDGYTQLDYIESTGTQYIDTGVVPNSNTITEMDYTNLKDVGESFQVPFGMTESISGSIGYHFYIGSTNKVSWRTGIADSAISTNVLVNNGDRHKYKLQYKKLTIDSNEYADNNIQWNTVTVDISIFARKSFDDNNNLTHTAFSKGRVYAMKISNGNTLVRDYIPCKNSSNEVGLYDLVNNVFYTNQGTGTFTAGNTVTIPNPDYPQEINNVTGDVEIVVSNSDNTESQTFTLNLGTTELCKIGNNQDYFYKDNGKWYLHKETKKLLIDEDISITTDTNNRFDIEVSDTKYGSVSSPNAISNYFVSRFELTYNSIFVSGVHHMISVVDERYIAINDFKTWLLSNNVDIYYVLNTPTNTEITDTTMITQLEAINTAKSYYEQTNISGSSDNANPLFSVEAYQNTKLVLASLS